MTVPTPYYQDALVRLYCGDYRKVLPALGEEFDCAITDPPYSSKTHAGARSANQDRKLVHFESLSAPQLRRALASLPVRRWTVAHMDWTHAAALEGRPPDGMRFVRCGCWVKEGAAPQFTGDRPVMGWEAVGVLHKVGTKMRWNGGGHHAVWHAAVERGDHPTQKPLVLEREFVRLFTDDGELVLDPWAGSGTTAVACKQMGRRCVAVEVNEEYCAAAVKRLRQELLPLVVPVRSAPKQDELFGGDE